MNLKIFAWGALMMMKLKSGLLAVPVLLVCACAVQAGVSSVGSLTSTGLAGHTSNDIVIDFSGLLRGQQMILNLTAGSIYQSPANPGVQTPPSNFIVGLVPDAQFDSFVSVGGKR